MQKNFICAENLVQLRGMCVVQICVEKKLCFAHFTFCAFLRICARRICVRGEFLRRVGGKSFLRGIFSVAVVFLCAEGNFSGGRGAGGGVRGGVRGGRGGKMAKKGQKRGFLGGSGGGGPKWAVSVPEWYTSGSASTASHSTGWQKSPEYALIRIAAGPPFPGHFPPPGPRAKVTGFWGPFLAHPHKSASLLLFSPPKESSRTSRITSPT